MDSVIKGSGENARKLLVAFRERYRILSKKVGEKYELTDITLARIASSLPTFTVSMFYTHGVGKVLGDSYLKEDFSRFRFLLSPMASSVIPTACTNTPNYA